MTTANFPDVMLPAYNRNPSTAIFFILYLIFGMYFLMNVLLAVVFERYKSRMSRKVENKRQKRSDYVDQYFELYDTD